jgi:hypothetical protein
LSGGFAHAFVAPLNDTRTRDDLAREIAARTGATEEAALAQVSATLAELTRLWLMIG